MQNILSQCSMWWFKLQCFYYAPEGVHKVIATVRLLRLGFEKFGKRVHMSSYGDKPCFVWFCAMRPVSQNSFAQ